MFAALIIGATLARQGSSDRDDGPGVNLLGGLFRMLAEAFFWTFHPFSPLYIAPADEASIDLPLLTFTPENFDTAQTVTITGKDDSAADGDTNVIVSFGQSVSSDPRYDGKTAAPFALKNADNDVAGIFVSPPVGGTSTSEAGTSVSLHVHLRTKPSGSVYVPIASSHPTEGQASPAGLVFTPSNYFIDQVVTITGQPDGTKDADAPYQITIGKTNAPEDGAYEGLEASVSLTNQDESILELVTNWGAACVRLTSGRVQCWGRNENGALGLGDNNHRGDQPGELGAALPFVNLGTGRTAKRIFGGMNSESAFCAIRDDDSFVCSSSTRRAGPGGPLPISPSSARRRRTSGVGGKRTPRPRSTSSSPASRPVRVSWTPAHHGWIPSCRPALKRSSRQGYVMTRGRTDEAPPQREHAPDQEGGRARLACERVRHHVPQR